MNTAEHNDALSVYLNDHLAGATAGVELSQRLARAHLSSPAAAQMQSVADDIAEDRRTLVQLMRSFGVAPRRYKVCAGWVVEKFGRLKPMGPLHRRSGLGALIELETLRLGIQGKYQLWQALAWVAAEGRSVDRARLEHLKDRAREQMAVVDELHSAASASALVKEPQPTLP